MIRRAKYKDLEEVLQLQYLLSPSENNNEGITREKVLKKIIRAHHQELLVYEESGKIIGTATVMKRENLTHQGRPAGYIENIVVDKKYRGREIGNQMVNKCLEIAKRWNCYKVILTCEPELARFYRKSGFKKFREIVMRRDID